MPSFRAVMIIISVFVAVLSSVPKSPISERQAITGALCAYYQQKPLYVPHYNHNATHVFLRLLLIVKQTYTFCKENIPTDSYLFWVYEDTRRFA